MIGTLRGGCVNRVALPSCRNRDQMVDYKRRTVALILLPDVARRVHAAAVDLRHPDFGISGLGERERFVLITETE